MTSRRGGPTCPPAGRCGVKKPATHHRRSRANGNPSPPPQPSFPCKREPIPGPRPSFPCRREPIPGSRPSFPCKREPIPGSRPSFPCRREPIPAPPITPITQVTSRRGGFETRPPRRGAGEECDEGDARVTSRRGGPTCPPAGRCGVKKPATHHRRSRANGNPSPPPQSLQSPKSPPVGAGLKPALPGAVRVRNAMRGMRA